MSRSYRKPIFKQGYGSRWKPKAKRQANRRVRIYDAYISNGSMYKKLFNSWDICDWRFDERFESIEYGTGWGFVRKELTNKDKAKMVRK